MSIVDDATLISAAGLAAALASAPELRIFDCTVHLRADSPRPYRIESGSADWRQARLPGAGFLDLTGALSDPDGGTAFTMPSAINAAAAFGEAGVVNDARIVLYASNHPMWATRVWWMLRSLGVSATVLDGGLAAWQAAGLPIESGAFAHTPGALSVNPRPGAWADHARVRAVIGNGSVCTLNALSPSMYRGEGERHYGRRGHISGSVNVPYASLFEDETLCFADASTLRACFEAQGAMSRPVIAYCGGGISATCAAFALTALGNGQVSVYDGSMAEWVADPDRPLTTGAAP